VLQKPPEWYVLQYHLAISDEMLVHLEAQIEVVVNTKPWVLFDVTEERLVGLLRECLDPGIAPLLAHGDSESMKRVEGLCC
jgi:hypothetical protein